MASIGGTTIPDAIANSGEYQYTRPTVTNGAGEEIETGYGTVTWHFNILTKTNYQWITQTLLAGARSKTFTAAQLYDDNFTLTSFSSAVAHRPKAKTYRGGHVIDVTWIIDGLT